MVFQSIRRCIKVIRWYPVSFVPGHIRPRTQPNFRMAPQTKNGSPSHLTHLSKNRNTFFDFFLTIDLQHIEGQLWYWSMMILGPYIFVFFMVFWAVSCTNKEIFCPSMHLSVRPCIHSGVREGTYGTYAYVPVVGLRMVSD